LDSVLYLFDCISIIKYYFLLLIETYIGSSQKVGQYRLD